MKTQAKKTAFLARLGPGFIGGVLLAMLVTVGSSHAGLLVKEEKLTPSDLTQDSRFGESVSVDGDMAVVGASGAAYIFVRIGTDWIQYDKLKASDAGADDSFGGSVSISGDTVVVGAASDDGAGTSSGSAYVYTSTQTRTGRFWSQQSKLTASDAAADDYFGGSVAISGDKIVVGAVGDDDAGEYSGSAYVFARSGATWTQTNKLTASDAAERQQFGGDVSISGDTVVVGAPVEHFWLVFESAYVFVRNGTNWIEQAKLSSPAGVHQRFGESLSISGDTVVVGAPGEYEGHYAYVGNAYVFVRNGSNWSQQAELRPTVIEDVMFGMSVAVSGDTILMGLSPGVNLNLDGATPLPSAHVFTRSGSTWSEQAEMKASDAAVDDGNTVAISGDTVFVGAPGDGDAGFNAGSAYVFDLNLTCDTTFTLPSNQWRQISLPCNPGANNTVTAVFGDDIPGTYGTEWILYRYDASGYVPLDATSDTLSQGVGYWIIQKSGSETTLDMPDNSAPTPTPIFKACPEGCFNIPLATQANATQWNMIGYPFVSSGSLGDVRVRPDSGSYSSVYNLDDAQPLGLVHSQLWTYNGSGYTAVDTSGNLDAWKGYWVSTLENADDLPLSLLVPKP